MQSAILLPVWAFVLILVIAVAIGAMLTIIFTSSSKKTEVTTAVDREPAHLSPRERARLRVTNSIRRAAAKFKPSSTFWTAHNNA